MSSLSKMRTQQKVRGDRTVRRVKRVAMVMGEGNPQLVCCIQVSDGRAQTVHGRVCLCVCFKLLTCTALRWHHLVHLTFTHQPAADGEGALMNQWTNSNEICRKESLDACLQLFNLCSRHDLRQVSKLAELKTIKITVSWLVLKLRTVYLVW